MSSLSIPRPKKMSDAQFIGDLTKLLERRKIKCGDPQGLETFGSELATNNILRSDLYTLCTAISHMADVDLSGEQLLVLVGRAVGGPTVSRGEVAPEIPDNMKSAFLTGYHAWSNRGSELNEPLPWPPPRPQVVRSEPLPPAEDLETDPDPVAPDPSASMAPRSGLHSIQEALEIAKKRSPMSLPPQRSTAPGANIDGLTINELKTLLDDIENRMSRLRPHLSDLNHLVDSAAGRQRRATESEDVAPIRATAPPVESPSPPPVKLPPAVINSLAAIAHPELSAVLPPTPPHVSEDAFLARHPYMRNSRRNMPDLPFNLSPVTPIDDSAAPVSPAPHLTIESFLASGSATAAPMAIPVAAPIDVPAPAANAAPVAAAVPAVPLALPEPAADLVPPPPSVVPAISEAPAMLNPIGEALIFVMDNLRDSPRLMHAVAAILLLVPTAFAGAFVYRYLHPPLIIRYADPPPVVQQPEVPAYPVAVAAPDAPETTTTAASTSQVRPAASDARPIPRPQSPITPGGTSRREVTRHTSQPRTQAFVWPPPPEGTSGATTPAPARPLIASATSILPTSSAARTPQPIGPPASAIYVPSSTMIKFAVSTPKPIYPTDRAKGLDGTVVLQITISKQGDVTSTKTVSGPIELRSAAVQAVRMWRFRPYLLSGTPVDVQTTIELPFSPQ